MISLVNPKFVPFPIAGEPDCNVKSFDELVNKGLEGAGPFASFPKLCH